MEPQYSIPDLLERLNAPGQGVSLKVEVNMATENRKIRAPRKPAPGVNMEHYTKEYIALGRLGDHGGRVAIFADSKHSQFGPAPNTQCADILAYLRTGASITPLEALDMFGCFRLGARIWDLRRLGVDIDSKMIRLPNGKRVAEFRLAK